MISAMFKKIECIEGQSGIFIDNHPVRPKANHPQGLKELLWMGSFPEIMV